MNTLRRILIVCTSIALIFVVVVISLDPQIRLPEPLDGLHERYHDRLDEDRAQAIACARYLVTGERKSGCELLPTETPTPSTEPTATPTLKATATPSPAPTPTPTATDVVAPTPQVIPTPSGTPSGGPLVLTPRASVPMTTPTTADPTRATSNHSLLRTSPAQGETGVAISRETILEFNGALEADSITSEAIFAQFGGEILPARLHLAPDGKRVTLFYRNPLPANAHIRVTVDGDRLLDVAGMPIDVDGDGNPGGRATVTFQTLTLATLSSTSVCGRVWASHLEERGSTSVNTPLEGATITVDGQEDQLRAATDPDGNFCLQPAPVGRFFVHIDGGTVTNDVPIGAFYPSVGKTWRSIPNQEVQIGNVYLPLVAPETLQPVSREMETQIRFPRSVLDEHPEMQNVMLTVPADSLFSDDGARGGAVGIAPVPPDRLPGQLPDDLDFPLVITVQTDGATNFDRPAPICFPNLPTPETNEMLEPGSKSALWSFNHDTGRWEIAGPMTVSEDGGLVCTDPGVGIRAPGWHGSQPGVSVSGGKIIAAADLAQKSGSDVGEPSAPDEVPPWEELPESEICPNGQIVCRHRPGYEPTVNGCGPANWPLKLGDLIVPDNPMEWWLTTPTDPLGLLIHTPPHPGFTKACNNHDIGYGIYGRPKDATDLQFLEELVETCGIYDLHPLNRIVCLSFAHLYHKMVAEYGQSAYDAAQLEAMECVCLVGETGEVSETPLSLSSERGDLNETVRFAQSVQSDVSAQNGVHYYAIHQTETGVVRRGRSESEGIAFDNLILSPDTAYTVLLYQPESQRQAILEIVTPASGSELQLEPLILTPAIQLDLDEDGLTEFGEYVIGTDRWIPDTDQDGLTDGAEISQSLNPLGDLQIQTGIIASASTPGSANDLCVTNENVVVAEGGAGVSLFNIFNGMEPAIVGHAETPGSAERIACAEDFVAVADGTAGLALVNTSDAAEPIIQHQIALGSTVTAVSTNGLAVYAGTSTGHLFIVHAATGQVVDVLELGEPIVDLSLASNHLVALSTGHIHIFTANGMALSPAGNLAHERLLSNPADSRIFNAFPIVYLSHYLGYDTIDISEPEDPVFLGQSKEEFGTYYGIATTGSGQVLVTYSRSYNDWPVARFDGSDPAQTDRWAEDFQTPGQAVALALYDGRAYIADGDGGVHAVNFAGNDTWGSAPTISLTSNSADGNVVERGQLLVTALAEDDVLVKRVELYLNGEQIATDRQYPFEFHVTAPSVSETSSLLLFAVAVDTGGNKTRSAPLKLIVEPDRLAPSIVYVDPSEGSIVASLREVTVIFDEPLDPSSVSDSTFQLLSIGSQKSSDIRSSGSISINRTGDAVSLTFAESPPPGSYRLLIRSEIADLAGNSLGSNFERSLRVVGGGIEHRQTLAEDFVLADGVISPDGRHFYHVASNSDRIQHYLRDTVAGSLQRAATYEHQVSGFDQSNLFAMPAGESIGLAPFEGIFELALSQNGEYLFVSSYTAGAIAVFGRDDTNGELTFLQRLQSSDDLTFVPEFIAASTDGSLLYVADEATMILFSRTREDHLQPVQTVRFDDDVTEDFERVKALVVSPDGKQVYLAVDGLFSSARIHSFELSNAGSELTPLQNILAQEFAINTPETIEALTISSDGRHIYAVGAETLALFDRNPENGELTVNQVVHAGEENLDSLNSPSNIGVSADGDYVYVISDERVTLFQRDPQTGRVLTSSEGSPLTVNPGSMNITFILSPESRHLYSLSGIDGEMSVFALDYASGRAELTQSLRSEFDQADGLVIVSSIAVSPDGDFLYTSGMDGVGTFARSTESGELQYVQTNSTWSGDEGKSSEDTYIEHVLVSQDGKHLYGATRDALIVFERNRDSGKVSHLQTLGVVELPSEDSHTLSSVVISPDSRHLYSIFAASRNSIAGFERDPFTGRLSNGQFIDYKENESGNPITFSSIAMSPDGAYLYAGSEKAIVIFSRDRETGSLSSLQQIELEASGGSVSYKSSLLISPDGLHLYSTSSASSTIIGFERDPATGQIHRMNHPRRETSNMGEGGIFALAISADGLHIYAALLGFGSDSTDSFLVFYRDPASGELRLAQRIRDESAILLGNSFMGTILPEIGFNLTMALALPNDGRHLYVATFPSLLLTFARESGGTSVSK